MKLIGILAVAAALAAGCAHNHEEDVLQVPSTTGATIIPNESALRMVSSSRCAREETCGHVGRGQRYDNIAQCYKTADLDERGAIGLDACPFGVDGDALRRCSDALLARPCEFPLRTIGYVSQCQRSALCW